jgi:alginate export protein
MNARNAKIAGALLAISWGVVPRLVLAEHELYRDDARGTKLDFTLDLAAAWYGGKDSWFGHSETFLGASTDTWADIGAAPGLTFETRAGKGTFFAALSTVYTSTAGDDASGLTVGLDKKSELTLELGNVGWKAEDLFDALEGDTLTITVGRQNYSIGSGLLINDGAEDGGERGGWYLAMRKAFTEAVVASLDSDKWLLEAFRLQNHPRKGGPLGEAYGANVEYKLGEESRLGTTYMEVNSNVPGTVKLDVYSARASWRGGGGFGVAGEYADESSSQISARGYYGEVSYAFHENGWSPVLSYRYAHFDGDNPATPIDERFHEIAYGFTDWGSWYQGEITGEYALGNGNLISSLLRVELAPREDLTLNAMLYKFTLDRPASFGVLSNDWGDEVNFTAEWQVNERMLVTGVLGVLFPGDAARQYVRAASADDWLHAMVLVTYSW